MGSPLPKQTALPTSCVTLGKLLNLSGPLMSHLYNGANRRTCPKGCSEARRAHVYKIQCVENRLTL